MASSFFHVVATDAAVPVVNEAAVATTTTTETPSSSASASATSQLFQRVWTITSEHQLQTLHIKVPGRVFIDHDGALNPFAESTEAGGDVVDALATEDASTAITTTTTDASEQAVETDASEQAVETCTSEASASAITTASSASLASPASPAVVAKIIVTGSSRHLLDDLLEVVPLLGDKVSKGVRFHVKNQNVELPQCAVLTQVCVSAASAIRELLTNGAEVVIGERVVVQYDPDASLQIKCIGSGDAFLSTASGISLASFTALKRGSGDFQIQTPALEVCNALSITSGHELGGIFLAADSVRAESVIAMAVMAHSSTRIVSSDLAVSKMLMIWSLRGGNVTIAGSGTAALHFALVMCSGSIDTSDIVCDNVHTSITWGGRAVVQAKDKLRAHAICAGRVQYAGERPALLEESTWFRWRRISGDFVSPRTADDAAEDEDEAEDETKTRSAQSLELRAHPPREPKVVDVRVRKSFFGNEPRLETANSASPSASTVAAGRWWRWTLAGSVAAAAAVVVVVAAKRKQ